MAKVYKMEIFIVDSNGDYDDDIDLLMDDIKHNIDDKLDLQSKFSKFHESEQFKWKDELTINSRNATHSDFEEYFKNEKGVN